jgi:predicted lipid-binding transport protein (Tim44 family)
LLAKQSACHTTTRWAAQPRIRDRIVVDGLVLGLAVGLVLGLGFWLFGVLDFGGAACVQHVVLRVMLVRGGLMPRRYVRFLEYAAERVLLRRVGGAYEFIHPLLLDHFADL